MFQLLTQYTKMTTATLATDKKDESPPELVKKAKSSMLWSESDVKEVKRLLSEGKLISDIATSVGRTEESILARMKMWRDKEITEQGEKSKSTDQGKEADKPANAGKSWKKEDDFKVRALINEGKKVDKIASLMDRTSGSIRARMKKYAHEDITSGKDETKTLELYGLDKDIYRKFVQSMQKGKKEKKKDDKKSTSTTPLVDLSAVNQKLDTLTNLVNLCLKNQDDHLKKINEIWRFCVQ